MKKVYRVASLQRNDRLREVLIQKREGGCSDIFILRHHIWRADKVGTTSILYSRTTIGFPEFRQEFLDGRYSGQLFTLKKKLYIYDALMTEARKEVGEAQGVFQFDLSYKVSEADFNILFELCKKNKQK